MTIGEYLSDRLETIVLWAVFAVATAGFLRVTGTGSGIILLLAAFWLLAVLCTCAAGYFKCRARLRELENIMEGLDEKYLFTECIPPGGSLYERRLLELFRRAGRAMIGAVSDARAAQREYREYVESWVHEIKTPITAAGLICRNADPVTRRKLSAELAQIESHVERALFYARAESPEKDFIIRRIRLSEIVDEAVERHRTLLIRSGIRVVGMYAADDGLAGNMKEMSSGEHGGRAIRDKLCETVGSSADDMGDDPEHIVYTDDKWAVFILGQLLQNAAHYRKEDPDRRMVGDEAPAAVQPAGESGERMQQTGRDETPVIVLSARRLGKQTQLTVRDNGIGIPGHELSRVFDRGFTGSNGRIRGGSTGMGLYLCRRLADCLELGIQIASREGEGTTVTLTFPSLPDREQ